MKIIKTSGNAVSIFEEDLTLEVAKKRLLSLKNSKQDCCKELKNNGRMLVLGDSRDEDCTCYSIVSNICQGYKTKHSF